MSLVTKRPSSMNPQVASGKYQIDLSLTFILLYSLVMEYANSGDLSHRVKHMRNKDQMFQEEVILKILTQMCLGI